MFGYVDHQMNSKKKSHIQSVTNMSGNRDSEEDAYITPALSRIPSHL